MTQTAKHMVIPAAGIDIGFYTTKFTLGESLGSGGTTILVDQFPSIAPKVAHDRLHQLANTKRLDGTTVSVEKVDHFVGKSVHSMVGPAGGVRAASDDYCQTPTYKALLLGAFFYIARHHSSPSSLVIDFLTLGLPLNTVYSHSPFVQALAEGEHTIPSPSNPDRTIKVIVRNVVVVAQPQGAMVNFTSGLGHAVKPDQQALVLDMGGGTFDWFVCDGEFLPNYQLSGAAPIGAIACAGAICERIKPGLRSKHRILDRVDVALRTGAATVNISGVDYKMDDYWQFARSVLQEGLDQMKRHVGDLDSMDHILLTGGGASLLERVATSVLHDYSHVMVMDKDPVFSNVRGFHIISKIVAAASH